MKKSILLSSLVLLMLNGCFDRSSDARAAAIVEVKGAAVDDLILNGVVTATNNKGKVLATTRTSSTDGTYTLDLAHKGIAIITVTCDDDSMMLDDDDNVTQIACPTDLALSSIANIEPGIDIDVHISPLTHTLHTMAMAMASGTITIDIFNSSLTKFKKIFNFDPMKSHPRKKASRSILKAYRTQARKHGNMMKYIKLISGDFIKHGAAGGGDYMHGLVQGILTLDIGFTSSFTDTYTSTAYFKTTPYFNTYGELLIRSGFTNHPVMVSYMATPYFKETPYFNIYIEGLLKAGIANDLTAYYITTDHFKTTSYFNIYVDLLLKDGIANDLTAYYIATDYFKTTPYFTTYTGSAEALLKAGTINAITIEYIASAYFKTTSYFNIYVEGLLKAGIANDLTAYYITTAYFQTTAYFSIYVEGLLEQGISNDLTVAWLRAEDIRNSIADSKQLFIDLRTQAMSVVDYKNGGTAGFLNTEIKNMGQALNGVVLDIGSMADILNTIADVLNSAKENNLSTATTPFNEDKMVTVSKSNDNVWRYNIDDSINYLNWNGLINDNSSEFIEQEKLEINASRVFTLSIDGTFPIDYSYNSTEDAENELAFNGSIVIDKNASTSIATTDISGRIESNGDSLEVSNTTGEISYTKDGAKYFKFHGITLRGIVAEYTVDGSMDVHSYVQNDSLKDNELGYDLKQFYKYFGLSIPKEIIDSAWIPDEVRNNNWIPKTITNSGWLANDVTFTGSIARVDTLMEGTLNIKWTNADTMVLGRDKFDTTLVKINYDGLLQMPESPEMLLSMEFENNETMNTLTSEYSYDSTAISLEASFDKDFENGNINISTHLGIQANIEVSDGEVVEGTTVTNIRGVVIGTVDDRSDMPVIVYDDGSFESLP